MTEHKLKLKKEFEADKEAYENMLENRGCSCHINPPCALCSHEGNPSNLIENPDAWYHLCPDCSTIMSQKGIHYDCPHCGFTTCASC